MRLVSTIVEWIVIILNIPMYAIAFPIMSWHDRKTTQRLATMVCPWCKNSLALITQNDIQDCGVRLRLTSSTQALWDRLPSTQVSCPSCKKEICFDRQDRTTSCDLSDAIIPKKQTN